MRGGLAPSPAVVGEGWDGGVPAAGIAPIEPFPRCRGKEPNQCDALQLKPLSLHAARVKLVVASFMQPIDLNCDWLIRLQRLNRAPDLR